MAIVLNQQQEQEKQQQGQQQPMLSGATPMSSAGAGQPTTQGAQQRPASSGQFTNVQRFIQANQGVGNQIAQRMGETTQRGVERVGQGVGELTGLKQQVGQERERISGADAVAEQIRGNVQALTQGPQFDQARQLITGQTAADQQRQQLQSISDPLQTNISRAQQQVSQLGSEPGRFNLLRQVIGAPSYTAGQQRLDQLLTQTEGGRTLGQQFQQQRGQLGSQAAQSQDLMGRISGGIAEYGQEASQASQMLTGLLGEEIGGVQTRGRQALEAETARRAQDEDILRRYFAGELTQQTVPDTSGTVKMQAMTPELQRAIELLQAGGLDPNRRSFGVLSGTPLSEIFQNFGARPTDINQVLSEEELARMSALQRLSGQEQTIQRDPTPGQLALNPEILSRIQERERQYQDLLGQSQQQIINRYQNLGQFSNQDLYNIGTEARGSEQALQNIINSGGLGLIQSGSFYTPRNIAVQGTLQNVDQLINQLSDLGYFTGSVDPSAQQISREQFRSNVESRLRRALQI